MGGHQRAAGEAAQQDNGPSPAPTTEAHNSARSGAAVAGELPGGVVTFMFTDIEGSTAQFRELGDAFPPLLEQHNAILRSVWAAHRGVEVKTEGDAFFVAFSDPTNALRAAVTAIEELEAYPWPDRGQINVRIGMHTGVGYPRDGDYIAYPVHQAARIGAVGNGGQVIVSPETFALLGDAGDISIHDLGLFRVRDFDDAIHLYQAERSATCTTFAPLRAQPDVQHNLPLEIPLAIGRGDAIAGITEQMSQSRVVTIVGPGGVGKTLLSLTLARQQLDAFHDGAWFVDLSSHRDGTTLRGAIADVLGVGVDELASHVVTKNLLLVLDNAEQATADVSRVVAELTQHAGGVSVLVTSREPLAIASERLWRLEPLDVAKSAVELFHARAAAVDPNFDPDQDHGTVVELVRRLDGLPLAIELAAARVSAMSIREIVESLDDRMRILRSRRRDLEDRQRTAMGLVDWSYQLLDEDEQLVFRRLGVFADHFDLDAATAASENSGLDRIDVGDIVWSLVEKSLVMPMVTDGRTRYRLLETLRAFAYHAVSEADELSTTIRHVGQWYRARFDPSRPVSRATASEISDEIANIRALAAELAPHDVGLGQWLAWVVGLHYKTIDPARGLKELAPLVEVLAAPGEAVVGMFAIQAHLANSVNDLTTAHQIVERGRTFLTEESGSIGAGWLHNVAALNAIKGGDLATGRDLAETALHSATELEQVSLLNSVGIIEAELGHDANAIAALEGVLERARRLHARDAEVVAIGGLGEMAHRGGDMASAARYTIDAIQMCGELGLRSQSALGMIGAARLMAEAGDIAEAVTIHAAADQLMAETGQTMFEADQALSDKMLAQARHKLGAEAFVEAKATGEALAEVELVDRACIALEASILLRGGVGTQH